MKKILVVLVICVLIAGGVFLMWNNPDLGQEVGNSISGFFDGIFQGKYVPYDKEFKINDLKISNSDYYFNTLTLDQQKMYTAVAIATKKYESVAKVIGYESVIDEDIIEDAAVAMEAFFADHPEVFYINLEYEVYTVKSAFGKSIEIKLKYITSDQKIIAEQIGAINAKIETILSEVKSEKDIEKEIQIHDILAEKIDYYKYTDINDIPIDKHTIYGALVKGSAVCDGISKSLQIILDRVGIESILVIGEIDGMHAWNLVKLNDNWYNVDLTSDKAVKDNVKYVIHSYFNVTDDLIKKTHKFATKEILPEANATEMNYYIYKDYTISAMEDFNDKLQNIIKSNSNDKVLEFSVQTGIADVPDKIISSLQKNKNNQYLTENLSKLSYYNILNSYVLTKKI